MLAVAFPYSGKIDSFTNLTKSVDISRGNIRKSRIVHWDVFICVFFLLEVFDGNSRHSIFVTSVSNGDFIQSKYGIWC